MDCDRIIVLSDGKLVVRLLLQTIVLSTKKDFHGNLQEFDTPCNLIQNGDSHLSQLARNAGETAHNELVQMALRAKKN